MRSRAQIKSHPVHPMLVAFPVGLLITSLAFDIIGVLTGNEGLWAAGWYCALAGVCGGLLAAVPGAIDLFSVVPPNSSARQRGYKHAVLNVIALVLFITVLAHRSGTEAAPDGTSLVLSAIGVLVLAFSGWLGGTLAYRNQIGVDHRYANAGQWRDVKLDRWDLPVCAEGDLGEGQMLLAEIAGARVTVGRCAEGLVAFSDHCTHRGGPLSDGALVGCTVQCPWHGSQFNVHTGRVVNGPAEEGIEAYETFVQDGKVYVRPRRLEQQQRVA